MYLINIDSKQNPFVLSTRFRAVYGTILRWDQGRGRITWSSTCSAGAWIGSLDGGLLGA